MAVDMSSKLLELYEYIMVEHADINITGISRLQNSPEYRDCVKSVLLKYMDTSLINQCEPEYKLGYLIVSNSVLLHQMNSMNESKNKLNNIENEISTTAKPEIQDINNDFNDL